MPPSSDRTSKRLELREREVLRVSGFLQRADNRDVFHQSIRHILTWAQNRRNGSLPREAWDGLTFEFMAGGRNCSAVRIDDDKLDIWAFRADEADKFVANRSWISEVIIFRTEDGVVRVALKLAVNSAEQDVQAVPAVPGYVRQITNDLGLMIEGRLAKDLPFKVRSEQDAEDLLDEILDPKRGLPSIVIALTKGAAEDLIEPFNVDNFSSLMVGLAHVSTIAPEQSFRLSERLGRRLSVFDGGIRVYRVGFTDEDDPYVGNPLIFGRDLADKDDANAAGQWLRRYLAQESIKRNRWDSNVVNYSSVKSFSLDRITVEQKKQGASDETQLVTALEKIQVISKQISEKNEMLQEFEEENVRLEEENRQIKTQLAASKYRVEQLTV